ncbi:MAG: DUF5686 and carboxypeptidase regulatory-like domain-containing protein [Melioribacteraceae bacterium]|nr:DUF5686 and carboxypeptidase regulatory-like domain-containing protein [Melioribacteraceae bacterium]
MKAKQLLLLIVLVQFQGLAQSNIVSGLLLSKSSNEPISFANISFNKNRGTVTNSEGLFELSFNSDSVTIKFSCVGFKDSVITFNKTEKNLKIYLEEISYTLNEVIVNPYTYAEKFILEAIKVNNKQRSLIRYYENDTYSKETIRANVKDTLRVLGIIEAVSKHSYLSPNNYYEEILAVSKSANMKNVPYSAFAISQKIDLQNEYSEIANFSIINPLNPNALDYYNFYLEKELITDKTKTTILKVEPKLSDIPLFEGKLFFNSAHKLLEANLKGNSQIADEVFDSLVLNQKFATLNNKNNLPYLTSFSINMNFGIFSFAFGKETSYVNYIINDSLNKPVITSNKAIAYTLNSNINLELLRNEHFKIPLTLKEKEFNEKMNRVFVDGSLFRKIFFFLSIDIPPLLFDTPVNIFEFNISKFSNIYKFNKVGGHFVGIEKEFKVNDGIINYTNLGYNFASKTIHFNNDFIWNYFRVKIKNGIRTLGEFNKYQTLQTIEGLTQHTDDYNYFFRKLVNVGVTIPVFSKMELTTAINFERKEGLDNNTNFSIFNRNSYYKPNYNFTNYNNNYIELGLTYQSNPNYHVNWQRNLKGRSTFLLMAKMKYYDKNLLNSSESFFGWEVYSKLYWELSYNIKVDISFVYFNQSKSKHISQYRFTNRDRIVSFEYQDISNFSEIIPFYTLWDYQHTVSEYLFIKTKIIWFKFPKILHMRTSFSTIFSYLKSFSTPNEIIGSNLEKDFFEYGIGIEGISFMNIYLVSNNYNHKNVSLQFGFML